MEQWLVASSILLWIVVLCNLLLTLALVRRMNTGITPLKEGLKAGQQAPAFSAETLGGQVVTLATYTGRAVVFLFVSPTCKPCREAMPTYEALGAKASRAGVELVLVSIVDAEQTRLFAEEFALHLPVLVAPRESNPFMQDYLLSDTPSYCFIDQQGVVQSTGIPSPHLKKWKQLVEAWEAQEVEGVGQAIPERR